MADAQQPQQPQPKIAIVTQYVRDLSFENVAAQKQSPVNAKPEIQVSVNLDAKDHGNNRYEVILKTNATAAAEGATMFIAELEYAGVFHIENVPKEQLHPFLMIECPRQLFPFARRIMSDITRDGGYPPLMLDMVDFMAIYRQELERRQASGSGAAPNGNGGGNSGGIAGGSGSIV